MRCVLCPRCGAPMSSHTQPALIPGRPDTVLLRCSDYRCDFTCMEADIAVVDVADYAAPIRTSTARAAFEAQTPEYARLR